MIQSPLAGNIGASPNASEYKWVLQMVFVVSFANIQAQVVREKICMKHPE